MDIKLAKDLRSVEAGKLEFFSNSGMVALGSTFCSPLVGALVGLAFRPVAEIALAASVGVSGVGFLTAVFVAPNLAMRDHVTDYLDAPEKLGNHIQKASSKRHLRRLTKYKETIKVLDEWYPDLKISDGMPDIRNLPLAERRERIAEVEGILKDATREAQRRIRAAKDRKYVQNSANPVRGNRRLMEERIPTREVKRQAEKHKRFSLRSGVIARELVNGRPRGDDGM